MSEQKTTLEGTVGTVSALVGIVTFIIALQNQPTEDKAKQDLSDIKKTTSQIKDHIVAKPLVKSPLVQMENCFFRVAIQEDENGMFSMKFDSLNYEDFSVINRGEGMANNVTFCWTTNSVSMKGKKSFLKNAKQEFASYRKSELAALERLELTMLPVVFQKAYFEHIDEVEAEFKIHFYGSFNEQYETIYDVVFSKCPEGKVDHLHVKMKKTLKHNEQ